MTNRRTRSAHSGLSRRRFLSGSIGALGLFSPWSLRLARAFAQRRSDAPAQAVIQIFLQGGLSHLDSFDFKPYAPIEVRGPFKPVPVGQTGEHFGQHLGRTAKVFQHLTVIRSMSHGEAAHERGTHNMLTGYRPSPAITYPSFGSVVSHEHGGRNNLPAYVSIPDAREEFLGTGYLSSAFAPFSVGGDPAGRNFRVRDLAAPEGVDGERLARRKRLVESIDMPFEAEASTDALEATDAFYEQAYRLIESEPARAAFDLSAEQDGVRNRYGGGLGARLLLARRLVEGGVRYVTVRDGGWDHHQNLGRALPGKLNQLDQSFSALIEDLAGKKLLSSTLVLLTTEFGRTPRINATDGRDHWPKVFSVVAAGGGFRGGVLHGASNAAGSEPERDAVSPADLGATLFAQLGIDPTKRLLSPGDRPIDIVRGGRVMEELLA
ncbi:MAG: DUF1501 domain-containing protein [Planctomycetota bacterium]